MQKLVPKEDKPSSSTAAAGRRTGKILQYCIVTILHIKLVTIYNKFSFINIS